MHTVVVLLICIHRLAISLTWFHQYHAYVHSWTCPESKLWLMHICFMVLHDFPHLELSWVSQYSAYVGLKASVNVFLSTWMLSSSLPGKIGALYKAYEPGKTHHNAEALSRAPIFPGREELNIQVDTALSYLVPMQDPALKVIYEAIDEDYIHTLHQ